MLKSFWEVNTRTVHKKTQTHQRSAAEQDHEYDEGFKPVVLHYDKAGFPECPPALVLWSLLVDLAALEPAHAACTHGVHESVILLVI